MSDYWGLPSRDYELSLLQFVEGELLINGYAIQSESLEICSGAGAIILTGVLVKDGKSFGLYLSDGPKRRNTEDPPTILALSLLPGIKNSEDLRSYILAHEYDFQDTLRIRDGEFKREVEGFLGKTYDSLYRAKIRDIYKHSLSNAADILRERLRKM